MSLDAAERETVFTISDDEKVWIVSSFRRADITKLRKNADFVVEEEGTFEGTAFVRGTLPMNGLTIRKTSGRGKKPVVASTPKSKRVGMPDSAARCSGVKTDGSPCGSLAKGDTGRCIHHQN